MVFLGGLSRVLFYELSIGVPYAVRRSLVRGSASRPMAELEAVVELGG
jgi:hypothetical protein